MQVAAKKSANLPDLSVRIMLSVLKEEGLSTQTALEAADMPEGLPTLPGEITARQEVQFQRAFVGMTGYRPDLWVKTGLRYHLPSYGQLGMALLTSTNLNEFVRTSIDGRSLDYSLADITPLVCHSRLRGETVDVSHVPDSLREFTVYRDVAAVITALRDVWNGDFPIGRIELALPRPGRREISFLGYPVVFNAERTCILWESDVSALPLHYGDPVLHAAYVEDIKAKSRVRGVGEDLVEVLCAAMMRRTGIAPTLSMLAADLGSSERTLQRRLLARGVRFRDLLDEARRRISIELLSSSDLSIGEVAWRLGYKETTSFNHAFRRWTGATPAALRRGL